MDRIWFVLMLKFCALYLNQLKLDCEGNKKIELKQFFITLVIYFFRRIKQSYEIID